jgi:hypothetical protein
MRSKEAIISEATLELERRSKSRFRFLNFCDLAHDTLFLVEDRQFLTLQFYLQCDLVPSDRSEQDISIADPLATASRANFASSAGDMLSVIWTFLVSVAILKALQDEQIQAVVPTKRSAARSDTAARARGHAARAPERYSRRRVLR